MNKNEKSIRIFSALILTAFAAAVLYFAGSIVFALKQGPERAERDFIKLSDQINSDAASLNRYQASEHKYIAAFIIYSQQNTLFAYPASSNLIQTDTAGTPVLRNSSPFIKIFNTSLSVSQMPNTVLSAAIYTLHPSDIYNPARISFLAVLVCTLAVFTVLVYYAASAKTSAPDTENTSEKTIPDYAMQSEDIDFNAASDYNGIAEYDTEDVYDEAEQSMVVQNSLPSFAEPDLPLQPEMEYEEKTGTEAQPEVHNSEPFADPMGLFSPATGVGWESYLETRLDAELVRSSSSEQDLALILLRIRGGEQRPDILAKAAAILIEIFKFRDFVFEYKKDGFAGILLNMNLDQAMVLAETLYTRLCDLLKNEYMDAKPAIGISTKSLRLLPGSRLLTEAAQALEKALCEKDMPIVAFRVNPDKYRRFVAESGTDM